MIRKIMTRISAEVKVAISLLLKKIRRVIRFFYQSPKAAIQQYLKNRLIHLIKMMSMHADAKNNSVISYMPENNRHHTCRYYSARRLSTRKPNRQFHTLNSYPARSERTGTRKNSEKNRELLDSIIMRVMNAIKGEIGFVTIYNPEKKQYTLWGRTSVRSHTLQLSDYQSIRRCVNHAHEQMQTIFKLPQTGHIKSMLCIPMAGAGISFFCLVLVNNEKTILYSKQDVRRATVMVENMMCALRLSFRPEPRSLETITNVNGLMCRMN